MDSETAPFASTHATPTDAIRGGLCTAGVASTPAAVDAPPAHRLQHPVFDDCLILRIASAVDGPFKLTLDHTESVTRAVRGALLHHAADPPPAALSGHAADGSRLERPHVAFLALPELATSGARATIAGVAIALPRGIETPDYQAILLATARWERSGFRLLMGKLGALRLEHVTGGDFTGEVAPGALGPKEWTRPSRRWASVTPVALPRNPGDLTSRNPEIAQQAKRRAEEVVADACAQVGLPRPARVHVSPRSAFAGVPAAPAFMPYPRMGSGFKRVCVHVEVEFEEEVAGPMVMGVGRYFGMGVLRLLSDSK
jgi:CRISPR-associated protein Csb2